ncbi:MAG: YkgJ family cysteine cluster protein [Desulfarculus sp.]|nr:YkgJ family cysteine cluster protein [Desulfarculus sp.]
MSGLAFECQRCSQCCHGEGGITLGPGEVPAAAELLGLSEQEFIAAYCDLKLDIYHIRVNQDGDCALLGPDGCRIHQAKPRICQRWPFFTALLKDASAFEEAKLSCPGFRPTASHQDFLEQYRAENGEKDR